VKRFDEAAGTEFRIEQSDLVNDARFKVSRFFVKVRKLAMAGFLDRRIVVAALSREAMEDVFLDMVNPLDQVINQRRYGRETITDRNFYRALARAYVPRPSGDAPR